MKAKLAVIIKSLRIEPAPIDLAATILTAIKKQEHQAYYQRLAGWTMSAAISLSLAAISLIYFGQSLAQAGLGQYLSLTWTDTSTLISNWPSFLWSLIEILPILGLGFVLLATLTSIWSIDHLRQQLQTKLSPI